MKSESSFFQKIVPLMAKSLALSSGLFLFAITILLAANYFQLKTHDPLNHPVLEEWMQKYSENPKDEAIKEKVRALDLLARKAYFTSVYQIKTGLFLAFFLLVIFLLSLKFLRSFPKNIPCPPTSCDDPSDLGIAIKTRKLIFSLGIFLISASIIFAWLSHTELNEGLILSEAPKDSSTKEQAIPSDKTISIKQQKVFTKESIQENWPCFRGAYSHGIAFQQKPPIEWDGGTGKNILWKIPVPLPGYNSPIVWGKQIFFSGSDGKIQEIYSLDAQTGNILWRKEIQGIPGSPPKAPKVTQDTGYAASSMCTDGERVYAIFTTGDIACLTLGGEILWARNLGVPKNHYGHSSSLLFWDELVFVQYDHDGGPHILALKAKTGETAWKTERDVETSWASPILVSKEDTTQIILSSSPLAVAYDTKTGKELWQQKCLSGEVGPSPAYSQDMVFITNVGSGFTAINIQNGEMVWEKIEGEFPEASSPVAYQEYIFLTSSHGELLCLESTTGNAFWEKEIDTGFYSSPIVADGKVYLSSRAGVTYIFHLSKEYSLIASPSLGEAIVTTPAFCHNRIYIRGEKHLFAIGH